jgi:hypothetical protein
MNWTKSGDTLTSHAPGPWPSEVPAWVQTQRFLLDTVAGEKNFRGAEVSES